MVDPNLTEDPDFPIVKIGKSTRAKGADLLFAGGLTFGACYLIAHILPLGLLAYGCYKAFLRKAKKEGFLFISGGIALYVLIAGFPGLLRIPMFIGLAVAILGLYMVFKKQGPKE